VKLSSPVINEKNLEEIRSLDDFNIEEISLTYSIDGDMQKKINEICDQAVDAVNKGSEIIIISDKGVDDTKIYVPSVIATGAIHHRLIDEGLRSKASIVVETA
jgi:hypothetical protein